MIRNRFPDLFSLSLSLSNESITSEQIRGYIRTSWRNCSMVNDQHSVSIWLNGRSETSNGRKRIKVSHSRGDWSFVLHSSENLRYSNDNRALSISGGLRWTVLMLMFVGFKLHIDFVFSREQVDFDWINILLSFLPLFHSFVNTQFVIDHFISPINRDQNNYNDISRDSTGVTSHLSRRDASSRLRRTCLNNDIFIRANGLQTASSSSEHSSPIHAEFDFDVLSALTMSPLWPFTIEEQHLVGSVSLRGFGHRLCWISIYQTATFVSWACQ